jgi:DNA-binding transcriptional regulator YiaG
MRIGRRSQSKATTLFARDNRESMTSSSKREILMACQMCPVVDARHAGSAIAEVRRLTGLTWDQLARLFNVSRRALHFWASGKAMAPSNEEQLQRLLAVVRKIDRGSAEANRALIFGVLEDGTIPFDLLANSQYERVLALLGPGSVQQLRRPPVAAEVLAASAPQPPEELVGALQDRVHPASGRLIESKAVRAVRRQ